MTLTEMQGLVGPGVATPHLRPAVGLLTSIELAQDRDGLIRGHKWWWLAPWLS